MEPSRINALRVRGATCPLNAKLNGLGWSWYGAPRVVNGSSRSGVVIDTREIAGRSIQLGSVVGNSSARLMRSVHTSFIHSALSLAGSAGLRRWLNPCALQSTISGRGPSGMSFSVKSAYRFAEIGSA